MNRLPRETVRHRYFYSGLSRTDAGDLNRRLRADVRALEMPGGPGEMIRNLPADFDIVGPVWMEAAVNAHRYYVPYDRRASRQYEMRNRLLVLAPKGDAQVEVFYGDRARQNGLPESFVCFVQNVYDDFRAELFMSLMTDIPRDVLMVAVQQVPSFPMNFVEIYITRTNKLGQSKVFSTGGHFRSGDVVGWAETFDDPELARRPNYFG